MALQLCLQFPPTASLPRTSFYQQIKSTPIFAQPKMIKRSTIYRISRRKTTQFTVKATTAEEEEEGEDKPQANSSSNDSETQSVGTQQSPLREPQPQPTSGATRDPSELGSEIRKAMRERDGGSGGGEEGGEFWGGVGEEIRKIEWPAFGKVLGTTGVVLGVIAGSSVVLLTVNAVLAELSDRIFAGKGVQDFFG